MLLPTALAVRPLSFLSPLAERRFHRIDPGRSREMGGTGLGLSLVKLTADAHSGRVELESTIGEGSTFRIHIPLAKR